MNGYIYTVYPPHSIPNYTNTPILYNMSPQVNLAGHQVGQMGYGLMRMYLHFIRDDEVDK